MPKNINLKCLTFADRCSWHFIVRYTFYYYFLSSCKIHKPSWHVILSAVCLTWCFGLALLGLTSDPFVCLCSDAVAQVYQCAQQGEVAPLIALAGARVFALAEASPALLHHTRCSVCSPWVLVTFVNLKSSFLMQSRMQTRITDVFSSFTSPGTMELHPAVFFWASQSPLHTKNAYCASASSRYHQILSATVLPHQQLFG